MPLNVRWGYPAFHGSSTPHTTLHAGLCEIANFILWFQMDVFLPTNYPTALQTKIVYCNVKLLMFILSTLAKSLLQNWPSSNWQFQGSMNIPPTALKA